MSAQGLIWSLPKVGQWVRYEGTFKQVDILSQKNQKNVELNWIRHLTLKCLSEEVQAEYQNEMVACQWIEIIVVNGKESEMGIDPGPVGARRYKVLVPVSKVVSDVKDKNGIRNAFLPIVKGYQKIGDNEVEPMKTKVLQVYPLISMLMHYRELKAGAEEEIDLPIGSIPSKKFSGEITMESPFNKTINQAEMWQSENVPFGLAKWKVQVERQSKDSVSPRSEFLPASEITIEMSAHEIGEDAQSELITPDEK